MCPLLFKLYSLSTPIKIFQLNSPSPENFKFYFQGNGNMLVLGKKLFIAATVFRILPEQVKEERKNRIKKLCHIRFIWAGIYLFICRLEQPYFFLHFKIYLRTRSLIAVFGYSDVIYWPFWRGIFIRREKKAKRMAGRRSNRAHILVYCSDVSVFGI